MSTGFDESVSAAWERFEVRLMAGLEEVGEGSLAISIAGEPAGDRCLPYVQLRGDGDLIQAEVSGNEFLDPAYGLDDNQEQTLMVLGWSKTSSTSWSCRRWSMRSMRSVWRVMAR